jgi:hypothetical protein
VIYYRDRIDELLFIVAMFHKGIYRVVLVRYVGENISAKCSGKGAGRERDNEKISKESNKDSSHYEYTYVSSEEIKGEYPISYKYIHGC